MRPSSRLIFRLSALATALTLAACQQPTTTTKHPDSQLADIKLPAGITLLKNQPAVAGEIAIPYQKYQLANGLTVIIHEDQSDPLVHVDVTYHVGSAREEMGKSGFAHFFEHMMFQGSQHVPDERHIQIITESGGRMNGTTNSDRTNYFQTVPLNQLEKVLWLESDRMGFLLPAVTEQKFEVQRETVKNERGQRIDNQPYGRLGERVAAALYPDGHPYSWPVIGHMDDLNRANVNDVKAFFLRWYGPNNATLTIGGAVKAADVLPLVEKYFAPIPAGPAVTAANKTPVTLKADRYISLEDQVHLPLVYLAFPTVYARHQDEAALDVLAEILGSGNNSLLYKNLIKPQKAVEARAQHACRELACEFTFYALPAPGSVKSLAETEALLRASLAEFEQRGVTDDDLLKIKAKLEADAVFGLQSVSGKVSQLAYNQTFFGEPDLTSAEIKRYSNVTKADVERVYRQYLQGKAAVVMSVVPKGQPQLVARADNFKPTAHQYQPSTTTAAELHLREAAMTFDRSKEPVAGANPAVTLPKTWQAMLPNQIELLGSQDLETPTSTILLRIPAGRYHETTDKAGAIALLAAMLNESTQQRSSEQLSLALEKLGSTINFGNDDQYLTATVSCLTKHLKPTLDLLMEQLQQPAFLPADFARLQQQTLQSLQQAQKNPAELARIASRQLMYGDHIKAYAEMGSMQSVSQLTVQDLQALYQQLVKPARSQLLVSSDLSQQQLQPLLGKALGNWQGEAPVLTPIIPAAVAKAGTIYLLDKPDAPQSEIRLLRRTMAQDLTGEYFRANLMNFAVGGNFNSRINLNLREDKGYTYGAGSSFTGDRFSGIFSAGAAVRADVTAAALQEFIKELKRYSTEGITADELAFMRSSINQADALKFETPQARLSFMATVLEFPHSGDFVKTRNEVVATIGAAELNALAARYMDPAQMSILVVGPAAKLQKELAALGLPVVPYQLK